MIFPFISGVIALTSAADAGGDVVLNGLRCENAAAPRIRATTLAGAYLNNGLQFDNTGRLVYVDATAGLPADTTYANGFPCSTAGALCISTGAVSTWANGIPYAANGAVCASVTV